MNSDAHQIISRVYEAKTDSHAADQLISDYMPFIKSETARFINRPPDKSDDELSIAMFAFYEAIHNYSRLRGSFLKFAALHIRNRLIDNYRKEKRNKGQISLDVSEDDKTDLRETIRDDYDAYEENELREATKQEIAELSAVRELSAMQEATPIFLRNSSGLSVSRWRSWLRAQMWRERPLKDTGAIWWLCS